MPDVRDATEADADRLATVYRAAYRETRELGFPMKAESVSPGTVADWIREKQLLVADCEGTVVGGVRLEWTDPNRMKLSRLGVHPDRKGEGVGAALLDRAESWARERDADAIWLTTPGEHPYLPNLYRGRGYEKTGDHPLAYREYDEITLETQL